MDLQERPILFFDGICNLCNSSVQWVIRRDKRGVFLFAPIQSQYALKFLGPLAYDFENPGSFVLAYRGNVYYKSEAVLQVLIQLGWPWRIALIGKIVPKKLRDALYSYIARRRYAWFGKQESCMIPTSQLKARFLD